MAADIQKLDLVDIELNSGNISRSWLNHTIGMADNKGNAFGVRVFRDGEAVTLSSVSVQGHFRDPHGTNISITDSSLVSVSGNIAYVILPQACYNYEGQFCLAIKLVGGGVTGTMRIVDGMVSNTNTSNPVTPTTVPTYQEILSLYDDMQDAADVANAAIAPEYSDLDFPVVKGELCNYNGHLYRAKQDISSSETWTSGHWETTTFGTELKNEESARQLGDMVTQNDMAVIYNEALPYDAGKIVIKDGVTYRLPNGHTAGTAWASTTKTIINLSDHFAGEVSDLKSAINDGFAGLLPLDLSNIVNQYISGTTVDSNIAFTNSTKSKTIKRIINVTSGNKYKVVVQNASSPAATSDKDVVITDTNDIVKQVFQMSTIAGASVELEINAAASGYLYVCVDANYESIEIHGGVLYEQTVETDDIKESLEQVENTVYSNLGEDVYTFDTTDSNVDKTIIIDPSKCGPILHFYGTNGTYTASQTALVLQYKANATDSWTDIVRKSANSSGAFTGVDAYYKVPATAHYLRVVSHNNSTNQVTLTLYNKQNKSNTKYYTYKEVGYTSQDTNTSESYDEYFRVSLKKGVTYKIGVYCDRTDFRNSGTSDTITFYESYNGNNERLGRNRIVDGELDFIPLRWTYFTYTPTYDMSLCRVYMAGFTGAGKTGKFSIAFEKMMDYPVGFGNSYCSNGSRFIHETIAECDNITVGSGSSIQALLRLSDEEFLTFRFKDNASYGYAEIVKNRGLVSNVSGYSANTQYEHSQFMHVINAAHLANGNVLVASMISDNSRNAYEYNPSTDTIVNTFTLPSVDPNNQSNTSAFILPVDDATSKFYIGYCAQESFPTPSPMTVYEYNSGAMTEVGEFDYLPMYTQDSCVFGGKLFIVGNDGYGVTNSYITVVNMATWKVESMYTITNCGEIEGIDLYNDGDTIKAFTAANQSYRFARAFIFS